MKAKPFAAGSRQQIPPESDWPELHAQLKKQYMYDEFVGKFRWNTPTSPRVKRMAYAGSVSAGYTGIQWLGRTWSEAHLAVFYVTGQFPVGKVLRLDGNKTSSRFSNLVFTLPDGRRFQGKQEITPHV